jgi:hypothetical protein
MFPYLGDVILPGGFRELLFPGPDQEQPAFLSSEDLVPIPLHLL